MSNMLLSLELLAEHLQRNYVNADHKFGCRHHVKLGCVANISDNTLDPQSVLTSALRMTATHFHTVTAPKSRININVESL
jgi:hypothetical protein